MTDVPDATNWAVTEFADTDLDDLRRTQRLVQLAHVLAQNPCARADASGGRRTAGRVERIGHALVRAAAEQHGRGASRSLEGVD
jgi:hypothetical protein